MTNGQMAAKEAEGSVLETGNGATAAVAGRKSGGCGRMEAAQVAARGGCMAVSVTAMALMLTASQAGVASIYGFELHLFSKWTFSHSYQYLVAVSAAATVYSLAQFLLSGSQLLRKSPVISSRRQAWIIFAADQIFAYAMMSAGSAASGVTNLNRTGIRHTPLPNFCRTLRSFCDHVALSILFTFFGCLLLASSALLDVIYLSNC